MRPEIIQSCLTNILKNIKSKDDNKESRKEIYVSKHINKEDIEEIYVPKHINKEDIEEEHLSI